MLLVTGDRDMYQLVTEHVNVVSTRKGLSDVAIMTPESVDDLYHGITPALVPDFYGLKGDTSDNIPGVPGIGPKKASALIAQYGSLDEVIAHADEVKGKMGENLRAHIDGDDGVQFARGIDGGKDFPAADSFREVAHGGSVVGVFPPVPYSPDAEQKNGENDEKCFAARFHARLHEVLPVDKGKRLLKLGMAARHGK